jgi:hypothetical protein
MWQKYWNFLLKLLLFLQKLDHNIGFWEKRQSFRRKLAKIAENFDDNIDPRLLLRSIKDKCLLTLKLPPLLLSRSDSCSRRFRSAWGRFDQSVSREIHCKKLPCSHRQIHFVELNWFFGCFEFCLYFYILNIFWRIFFSCMYYVKEPILRSWVTKLVLKCLSYWLA